MTPYTIAFFVDKEAGRTDGKLRMRVRWGKDNRVSVNLGYRVELDKWSADSQRVKANTTHGKKKIPASRINADIQSYERKAGDAFRRFDSLGVVPSVQEFRSELRRQLGREDAGNGELFRIVFDSFIRKESVLRSWSRHTEDTCREVSVSVDQFSSDIAIGAFDGKVFEDYYVWMVERGLANRTIRQRILYVKSFLRWAREEGHQVDDGALAFRPRVKVAPKTVVWLTMEELQALIAHADGGALRPSQRAVLDCFLLSCFTGLRKSDIENLRWSDISDGTIRVVTSKTSVPLFIELNKYSRAIVERQAQGDADGFVMPRLGSLNTPSILKRICRDAGLDAEVTITEYKGNRRVESVRRKCDMVSMHTGRRTFICNALSLGISHLTIMKWTGHTDYSSMKPYVDISASDKAKAMSLFDSV